MSLDDMALFVRVVEAGSFTRAASEAGASKSAVSKRVAALEARLGARLLERTTRSMRLTDVGRRYFTRAQEIVSAAEEAELEAAAAQDAAVGTLRLSAPVSFGVRYLGEAIARFAVAHPEVRVRVDLDDRYVDLIEEDYDLAVRVGSLPDSSLVARALMTSRPWLVASPEYLATRARPRTPKDLERHEALLYRHQVGGRTWHFEGRGGKRTVRVQGRLVSDNGDILAAAACHGVGIALLPDFIVEPHVASGRLEVLLPTWCRAESEVFAVYPHRNLSAKVRLFLELLQDCLRTPSARRRSRG